MGEEEKVETEGSGKGNPEDQGWDENTQSEDENTPESKAEEKKATEEGKEHPNCNVLCDRTFMADGECDEACDNEECGFDGGDCKTEKPLGAGAEVKKEEKKAAEAGKEHPNCDVLCDRTFMGDGECDEPCDNAECGFDGGDCKSG